MRLLLINIFLYSLIFCQIPSKEFDDWNVLQDADIWIGYIERDYPWCKASSYLSYPVDQILVVIENINEYSKILDSVAFSKKDDNDIAHIQVNYPFPFSDREYIVKFRLIHEEQDVIYTFSTNNNLNMDINKDYVRLINAAGQWRLSPVNDSLTEVSYIWNGELRGGFPSWSLSKAWIRQGNEVLSNLKTKLEGNNEK